MKVITIGTPTLDIFLQSKRFKALKDPHFKLKAGFPQHEGLCFPLGEKIELDTSFFSLGGGALNTAETFAKMGMETTAVFKLGRDLTGEQILKLLRHKHFAKRLKLYQGQSDFSIIVLSASGERTIFIYRDKKTQWQLRELPQATGAFFYITPGDTSIYSWINYFKQLKQHDNIIACNPSVHFLGAKKPLLKKAFAFLDVLLLNKEEAEKVLGAECSDEETCQRLQQVAPQALVVVTLGKRGVLVNYQSNIFYSSGFKAKKVVDMTGAGDAFGSAFCGYLINHGLTQIDTQINTDYKYQFDIEAKDIKEAIRRGCANAVSVIEKLGAQAGILDEKGYRDRRFKYLKTERLY